MRATPIGRPPARPLLAALSVLAAAAASCGDTLVDHRGRKYLDRPDGGGAQCGAGQVACTVAGAVTCQAEDALHCGDACEDCTATVTPPASGRVACLPSPGQPHGQCGYECTGGLLKCSSGCCQATALAGGKAHTCALLDDGTARCWGENGSGQLGSGAVSGPIPFPVAPSLPSAAVAVGAGAGHSCAALGSGEVYCWGANGAGQASGVPSGSPVLSPVPVPGISGATGVALGAAHTCALLSSGEVRCWGESTLGETGGGTPIPSGALALSAGASHTCAALASGEVGCWGSNATAQLGDPLAGGFSATPVTTIAAGYPIVAAGGGHACAATGSSNGQAIDDSVVCWGDAPGAAFSLGEPQPTPKIPLKRSDQSTVRFAVSAMATGRTHVCVVKSGEDVQCFGPENGSGQLGGTPPGPAETVPVPNSVGARALAAGDDHTCAVFADGGARCWGANYSGQLGNGTTALPGTGVLVEVSGR